jgi:hypothetical protein
VSEHNATTDKAQIRAQVISAFVTDPNHKEPPPAELRLGESKARTGSESSFAEREAARKIAAINLAEYGEDAIPAVKMCLASDEPSLRSGAVMVLQQMYRSESVRRNSLLNTVVAYSKDRNPYLRRGALEWFVRMGDEVPMGDRWRVFDELKTQFGSTAEVCANQDEQVALEAGKFLFSFSVQDSKEFAMGMVRNCSGDGAREAAVNALPRICSSLPGPDRKKVVIFLRNQMVPSLSNGLRSRIEAAIVKIEGIQGP